MSPTKPGKTLADYLAIALSPALIMALVGSLVFFTLEFSYRGQYAGSLRWMLFWFVLASVLISRISIEHGSTHAGIYGLGLGAAVALKMFQFIDSVLLPLCLLGMVWWCASKLVWDCTLIDEEADASGEGLLQIAGLDESKGHRAGGQAKPQAPGLSVVY